MEGGRPDGVRLMLDGELTLLMGKGQEQQVQLVPELPGSVRAPVRTGQAIGFVRVEMNGRTLARLPVVAASASEVRGIGGNLRRLWQCWPLAS